MTSQSTEPLTVTLDIAATVSAIIWPIVVVVMLYLLRERIPALLKEFVGRVTKLDIAGVTLEFAKAKAFAPDFSSATGGIDLRKRASAMQVNDSTAGTFLDQLRDPTRADYAIVNLGTGDQWLTSRLYIMALVFARMKGLRAFVFLGQSSPSRHYLGWSDPNRIRWALARRYPWLEAAYSAAYADVTTGSNPPTVITSPTGRIGNQFNSGDPGPSIELLRRFLQRIQWPPELGAPPLVPLSLHASPVPEAPDWVLINKDSQIQEHATWLTSMLLDEILGDELNFAHVELGALQRKSRGEQVRLVLAQTGSYVAVTREDLRFEYLIDRSLLLEQVAHSLIDEGEKS